MTKTHYQSNDRIVQILITTDDDRYPRHDAPMAVVQLRPKDHSRCRQQWGGVTVMFQHEEIRALLEAVERCDPKFHFSIPHLNNKPKTRSDAWRKRNLERLMSKRHPGGWIP